jgi:hypothetical protein
MVLGNQSHDKGAENLHAMLPLSEVTVKIKLVCAQTRELNASKHYMASPLMG